ncbi:MAG: RluA family pseudouridine synthase [Verrucomicrobia bacterium]|nr:RluA family pseudouridine synthase [Verrucomicrobiota bacterium]
MSERSETVFVTDLYVNQRLDTFLRSRFAAVSRETIRRLIDQGEIRVDGGTVKPSHRPVYGERIDVHWPEPKSLNVKPEEIPLDILYEDDGLLVLNKTAGLVVHPAAGHEEHTLVNALLHYCRGRLSGIGGVARPGIVHRLDKETSGCLVVAKSDAAHLGLSKQFAERQTEKVYEAIVCGHLRKPEGEIRAAIARHPSHRKRMAVTGGKGREAWTTYRLLGRLRDCDHVEAELHTGRTHQLRVHFQHVGHPLAGDSLYGSRQTQRLEAQTGYVVPRVMLHARTLKFSHPDTGQRMTFNAPLPDDFLAAFQALQDAAR